MTVPLVAAAGFILGRVAHLGELGRVAEAEGREASGVPSTPKPGADQGVAVPPDRAVTASLQAEEIGALGLPDQLAYFLGRFEADPEGALVEACQFDRRSDARVAHLPWLANLMAERDPRGRVYAATRLAALWGEKDPESAVAWLRASMTGPDRLKALIGAIPASYVSSNPRHVLEWIFAEGDRRRWDAAERWNHPMVRTVQMQSMPGIFSLGSEPGVPEIVERALAALSETDPRGALELASEGGFEVGGLPYGGPGRKTVAGGLFAAWVREDRNKALAWLGTRSETFQTSVTADAEFVGMFRDVPVEEAVAVAETVARGGSQDAGAVVRAVLSGWRNRPAADLSAFLDALPEDLQADCAGPVVDMLLCDPLGNPTRGVDFDRGIQELARIPESDRTPYERRIVDGLLRNSPQRAVAFIDTIPEERWNPIYDRKAITSWMRQDLPAVREWTEGLPPGERREQAVLFLDRMVGLYGGPKEESRGGKNEVTPEGEGGR